MNICAHRVLVLGILPRKRGLTGNTHDFDTNRAVYNSTMKRLCGSSARADFKKIRDFETIPVDDWSLDGIHPRNMSHYALRLSFHMMSATLKKKKKKKKNNYSVYTYLLYSFIISYYAQTI